jgi:23S rRNA maturation-related 3'-5' exoribonuclease YhaM
MWISMCKLSYIISEVMIFSIVLCDRRKVLEATPPFKHTVCNLWVQISLINLIIMDVGGFAHTLHL